ncbi:MAG: N(4)-(beta-N-acetylglucosaminyl)-L-asparaginase [Candidatus Poribacteria bacterium]|nr:MAG: N(4)-(beta-N-acetylglucosaminyl)-L-asparaginase [Candidatus Poribacteria bacterium]
MTRPIAVATWRFGLPAVEASGRAFQEGGSAMDAVEAGIRVAELDPSVDSVGYGGLPNADGVVQLDAAVMDGPTHEAGAVGALEGFRTPISIARRVMERSRHVFLVGEGARQFALREGFQEETTLTEEAKRRWEEWRTKRVAHQQPAGHDTIGLVAMDSTGNLAVGCSTSGLAFKEPGRVGDSPLIGSGLYVDNEVGGASATGVGEAILRFCLSFLVVELMRNGLSPQEACVQAIRRMVRKGRKFRKLHAAVIALDRSGRVGGYANHDRFSYAVWTPEGAQLIQVKPDPQDTDAWESDS